MVGAVGLTGLVGDPPKPEPFVDPKPEPLLEPEPDPGLDPNPDPLLEPNPDPLLEPNPDPLLEPNPDPVLEPNPDPVLDPKPDPVLDPKPVPVLPQRAVRGGDAGASHRANIVLTWIEDKLPLVIVGLLPINLDRSVLAKQANPYDRRPADTYARCAEGAAAPSRLSSPNRSGSSVSASRRRSPKPARASGCRSADPG